MVEVMLEIAPADPRAVVFELACMPLPTQVKS